MEQLIRFCTSADGTRIAYATYPGGEGSPLVMVATWNISMEQAWRDPQSRAFTEGLAHGRLLVDYDRRGTGASQRDVDDLSPEAHLHDLEAVVDEIDTDHFDLYGMYDGAAVALAYAVKHPERVSHLILFAAATRGEQTAAGRMREKIIDMIRSDWSLARRVLATAASSYVTAEDQRMYSRMVRESISPEIATRYLEYVASIDLAPLLPRVAMPTLVIIPKGNQHVPVESAREVAARIPDARFMLIDDVGGLEVPKVLDQFLRDALGESAPATPAGTAIILFADIADSTALTERLGDAAFREKARALDEALRREISANGGTAIEGKLLGDGVLAVFGAAREAVACAMAIHGAGSHAGLPLHVGIHAGDVIREEGNVYGGAVNIAARVASEAAAGETLVSGTVRDLARTSAGVSFEDRGERELKGVGEPVRMWAVREGKA